MDIKPKKERFYTFMIVPHDARGRPVSLKIPARWVSAAIYLAIFSFLLVGSSIVYSTLLSRKLVNYAGTISRSRQQQVVINSFSDKTSKVSQAINELVAKDNELRKLLGLKGWESKVKLSTDQISPEAKVNKVSLEFELASAKLAERRQSLEELKQWVSVVRSRFASTPSTWPIYGRIASFFGYRVYPWRGVHTGIDISSHYGAPARATAAGVVSYVGWRRGYGKTVEIDHGYGVKTLYAHNSNYAVRVGQRVNKGQVVSYVGMTGWTTGPHLHYEVRRWDRPINPVAFLDLNILSASRFWR
ncbi:MAG: M23 family metallopeptidase [Candidatus Margulisbacteria bacterium]|nr:M23 family metallopeptidase [Candidatus Margulisiibacteriota bacterium]